jgi:hypothetical protein
MKAEGRVTYFTVRKSLLDIREAAKKEGISKRGGDIPEGNLLF